MTCALRSITDLRAAVVGTGFIGLVHIEALRRLGVEIVGVLGSSPQRARAMTHDLGIRRVFETYQQLLDDDTIDVVHIASPNNAHFAQAKQALLAGKHVICEKPLAMTSAETRELRRIAEDSGLVHAVNYNIRFYSQVVEARARITNQSVGELRLITGSYRQDWLSEDTDWSWRVDTEVGGELRSVADIGSHLIDLLEFVTGRRVTHVLADLMTFLPVRYRPTGPTQTFAVAAVAAAADNEAQGSEAQGSEQVDVSTDDASTMLVRFDGGARGVLAISQVSIGHKNAVEFEITGSRSSLGWNSDTLEQLWIGHRHAPNEVLWRDPTLLNRPSAATLPGGHVEGFENTFKALYRAVYQQILRSAQPRTQTLGADVAAGDIPFATFDDGHHEALVMDAIRSSATTSAWTAVAAD